MADYYGTTDPYNDDDGGYRPPGEWVPDTPAAGGAGSAFSSYFFNDPVQRYYETAIRKRIGEAQDPLKSVLPGMDEFKSLLGQFGGGYSSSSGGAASPGPSRLDPFKAYADSFNPGVSQSFNDYIASQGPNAGMGDFQNYVAGRAGQGTQTVEDLKAALAAMGPNTSIDDLKAYFGSRDQNAPINTLKDFLTKNEGMLSGYEGNMAARIAQLRGNPFDDTVLEARRHQGFEDIERERTEEKRRLGETMAARGIQPGSGLFDRAQREIDQRYDARRAEQQGLMTTEEFQLREDRNKQADILETQGATFRLQSAQLAGDMTSQIASLQQQGIAMNDALQQTIAQLGLQDRRQEQEMLTQIATLTNQGYELEDALQMSLANAGLKAQEMANQLRISGAEVGLKEADMMSNLQKVLAELGVTERGQDTNLQIAGIDAASRGENSRLGALMDYFRIGQDEQKFGEERLDKNVNLAQLLYAMQRQGLLDAREGLPDLSGG
jgi:hypothetical protein